jgi:Cu(I)/Ag(I) efflux system membrane fusion protein
VIYPHQRGDAHGARADRACRIRILLLPDMYVDAEIDTGSGEPVLAVPDSAVIDSGSRQAVFVDKGEGRFEPREVKLGHRGSGYVEVREGVAEASRSSSRPTS